MANKQFTAAVTKVCSVGPLLEQNYFQIRIWNPGVHIHISVCNLDLSVCICTCVCVFEIRVCNHERPADS